MTKETREVFLPAKVLELCLDDWDDAGDEALSQAVGETMEHAFLHLRWLLAIREFRCRLVVVQLKNPQGAELNPHYQLGDLITLSGWHPERALEEARELIAESGDGLTFDLPVDDEMLKDWAELAESLGIEAPESRDDPNELELLASAMVLLDAAHDDYVQDLGEDFYIATRGAARAVDALCASPFGEWSAETMQVIDPNPSTAAQTQLYPDPPSALEGKVPVVYQPSVMPEEEEST
jgi:hypothetical protein